MSKFSFLISLFLIHFYAFAGADLPISSPNNIVIKAGTGKSVKVQSKLQVESTSQASRPYPSMTTTQRDALTATEGETIFNSTTKKINIFTNSAWGEVSGGAASSSGINFFQAGDFESGLTTGWTVSAGTLTATTAQAIQGVDSGLWTITGAGTIDLCATPTNLANTALLASGWVKSTSTDLQVCSVVNSVENGCTPLGTVTGWKKVTASATYASGNFCFRLKSVASGAITAYVDDVKLEPLENQQVSTVEQESITLTGYTSGLNPIVFSTVQTNKSGNVIAKTSNSRITFIKSGNFQAVIGGGNSSTLPVFRVALCNPLGNPKYYLEGRASAGGKSSAPIVGNAEAGDYLEVQVDASTGLSDELVFSITATAVRDNVIQATDGVRSVNFKGANVGAQSLTIGSDTKVLFSTVKDEASSWDGDDYTVPETGWYTTTFSVTLGNLTNNTGYFIINVGGQSVTKGVQSNEASNQWGYEYTNTNYYKKGSLIKVTILPVGTSTTPSVLPNAAFLSITRNATIDKPLFALPVSKDNNKTYDKTLVSVTSTVPSFSVSTSNFYPYRTISKVTGAPIWRMAFNIVATGTRVATTYTLTISGVTFINVEAITSHLPDRVYTNAGASTIVFDSLNANTNVIISGDVELASKPTWADEWNEAGVFISNINPDGFNKTSGQVGLVESFSFSFGTTNATTVCSASPCSYLDQIGNNVTSVTRSGVGDYVANFSKTFSKIKCFNVFNYSIAGNPIISQPTNNINGNSVGIRTQRFLDGAFTDSFGTIYCQGY